MARRSAGKQTLRIARTPIQVYDARAAAAVGARTQQPSEGFVMARFFATTALLLVIAELTAAPVATAAEASHTEYSLGGTVPLSESDLQKITLQVMQSHPLLSSSPGIKFASAQRSVRSTDIASIVYFPHAQSAGIKAAFQVRCLRHVPDELWKCDEVELRRYLQLDSQNFEVRVTGDIRTEEALALIEATRGTVQASATDSQVVPQTVIQIHPDRNGYLVSWGSPEGYQKLMVRGRLRAGGNPTQADDWQTQMFEFNE